MRFKPKIGRDFPITKEIVTEVTRSILAVCLVSCGALVLLAAGIYCLYEREAQPLLTVWAFVSPPVWIIIGYYFRGTRGDRESDDEGST
jgi:hypothetical protein